jgi:hypothetical protein
MSYTLEFSGSAVKIDFCSQGNKQKNLIDVLIKYDEMDINELALILQVPVERLHGICDGHGFLVGEQADSLIQLFLMFLGRYFFINVT